MIFQNIYIKCESVIIQNPRNTQPRNTQLYYKWGQYMKKQKNKNKPKQKQFDNIWELLNEYEKIKWNPPKQNNLSFLFIWSIFGLFKPKPKQNNFNNKYKNY